MRLLQILCEIGQNIGIDTDTDNTSGHTQHYLPRLNFHLIFFPLESETVSKKCQTQHSTRDDEDCWRKQNNPITNFTRVTVALY